MREAAMAVIAYGFAVKDLNRVNALVAVGNVRSARLLTTLGFREEAMLRQFAYWKGEFHDMHLFGLLRGDVEQQNVPSANAGAQCAHSPLDNTPTALCT